VRAQIDRGEIKVVQRFRKKFDPKPVGDEAKKTKASAIADRVRKRHG
jgi:hypothetical protein